MGWKAPSIHVWTNDQGEKFEVDWYNPKLWSDLKIHLESSLLRQQITKIAQQPGAKGLEGPLDIAFHSKFLRYSFTKGLGPFVQTLWQGALQHASNSAQLVCVHCGAENTLKHQLWDCSWVNERHKPVPAVWQPHVGDESQQHFWLRGLLPSSWTQQDYTDDQLVRTGIFTQPTFDASLFVFGSDGSGGPFSQEPRVRRCSWSVVAVSKQHPTQILGTISGLLVGKQTVPAAEAFAFKELLGRSHGPVTLVVDAKYVINKWQKIRNPDNIYEGSNPEIWTQIADHQNREVSLIKIKSHLKREQFEHLHGSDNVWQWWVNFYADDICDQRAADLAPRNHSKVVDWVLGRAWKLNLFLAERVQLILTEGPKLPQEPRKTRHTKQAVFTHAVDTKVGEHAWKHNPKGGVVCTHCGKSIKPYLSLADIEVHLRQACQSLQVPLGIRIHHSHDITAIPGQTGQSCRLCGAVVRKNAKRLMVPCR